MRRSMRPAIRRLKIEGLEAAFRFAGEYIAKKGTSFIPEHFDSNNKFAHYTLWGYNDAVREVLTMCDHDDCHLEMQPEKKTAVPRTDSEKQKIVNRLKRLEGQVRGLQKMIEEDRYCIDILIQLSAAQAALKKVGFSVLERHTKSCVKKAIQAGHGDEQIEELIKVLKQFSK